MRANIDSPLDLSHSGTQVAAHGPITEWDADEVSADITITIRQNGTSAHNKTTVVKPATSWQMTIVAPGGGFGDGPADGTGDAVVDLTGGGTEPYHWTKPIALAD